MRCSCKECGTYMIQAESDHLGCRTAATAAMTASARIPWSQRTGWLRWPLTRGSLRKAWRRILNRTTVNGKMTEDMKDEMAS